VNKVPSARGFWFFLICRSSKQDQKAINSAVSPADLTAMSGSSVDASMTHAKQYIPPKTIGAILYGSSLESPIPRSFVDETNFAIRAKAFREELCETPSLARILLRRSLSIRAISFPSESLLRILSRFFSRIRN